MDDIPYKELSLTLKPGEDLFLYTDGVTEAMSADLELYSDERLLVEMEKLRGQALEDVVAAIRETIRDHAGTAPQSDDIGMLIIRYLGNDA
jgi:sigma-B regulation protein RsbU (phosphoserine phosphatase)